MGATAGGVLPGTSGVVLVLRKGGSLSGRVLLPDGKPAPAGIAVTASAVTGGARGEEGTDSSARTEKDGSFRMTGLGEFEFRVVAGGRDSVFAPTAAAGARRAGDAGIEVRLDPGVSLSGRFVDAEGRGLMVNALFTSQEGFDRNSAWGERISSDGLFVVKGLRPGKVSLQVIVGGEHVGLGWFDAPAADLKVNVPLR